MNGTSKTINNDKLGSIDAGQHTCIATDDAGNTGNASTEMNIVGQCP